MHLLIGLLSTSVSAASPACGSVQLQKSQCRTSSDIEPARKNDFYQNSDHLDSFFTLLQQESLQKVEELQKDPVFQEIVDALQNNAPRSQYTAVKL